MRPFSIPHARPHRATCGPRQRSPPSPPPKGQRPLLAHPAQERPCLQLRGMTHEREAGVARTSVLRALLLASAWASCTIAAAFALDRQADPPVLEAQPRYSGHCVGHGLAAGEELDAALHGLLAERAKHWSPELHCEVICPRPNIEVLLGVAGSHRLASSIHLASLDAASRERPLRNSGVHQTPMIWPRRRPVKAGVCKELRTVHISCPRAHCSAPQGPSAPGRVCALPSTMRAMALWAQRYVQRVGSPRLATKQSVSCASSGPPTARI